MLPGLYATLPQTGIAVHDQTMDFSDARFSKKRESRTRAPTACQTCRLRKTRCDNTRPTCSYCAVQGVECIYPETSPRPNPSGFDPANQEILQQLGRIYTLLEDLKHDGSSTISSARSLRESFFELTTQNPSPLTDMGFMGSIPPRGSSTSGDDRACEHDPFLIYAASSPELMLRWPIYNQIITDAEKHIRSFLLDSLDDDQPRASMAPPQQAGFGLVLVDDIQPLCRKYHRLVHRRNPVVDIDKLERYAREVTLQGLGWDGPSCQVLLACALACCTSTFLPLGEIPENLDRIPAPPPSDANLELAEAYFHAAKQRFGSLHTSPTDIQCYLLAGFYHRHAMRPLQAWFCFQQASCRLEVRLRSLCREQWTANADYHNLESRLYWSCIQAEHEMQGELPLWSSSLESLGYSDPFPMCPKTNSSSPGQMETDTAGGIQMQSGVSGTDEERGWKFYIGSICNRRTVNDMLIDMWRNGEDGWLNDVNGIVDRISEAAKVITSWYVIGIFLHCLFQWCHGIAFSSLTDQRYQISLNSLPSPSPANQDLEFFLKGRCHIALERIYRPIFYLAIHYQALPSWVHASPQISSAIFTQAQNAIDNFSELLPNFWYHFRHEWIWNIMRCTFAAAIQILASVLSQVLISRSPNPGGWALRPPGNWTALLRLSIRILKHWEGESVDLEIMRNTLERMYQGTCRLAGARSDLFSG
ncbi:hypothetical protein N7456_000081 [Penicillium angulare]|uniref:Zn(2)-C6 fungal-type domain-containing protein n=1 Tax=Penicillium angulare TaxID=116970 RepID=A0A9W9GCV8_9EURO|nr:hypothetical protein N7456_000081 [Penicillium angulare]